MASDQDESYEHEFDEDEAGEGQDNEHDDFDESFGDGARALDPPAGFGKLNDSVRPGASAPVGERYSKRAAIGGGRRVGDMGIDELEKIIEKLTPSNHQLRRKVDGFKRALSSDLKRAGAAPSYAGSRAKLAASRGGYTETRPSITAGATSLSYPALKTHMKVTERKLEQYSRDNTELRRQVDELTRGDRIGRLESRLRMRDAQLAAAQQEARLAACMHRAQERRLAGSTGGGGGGGGRGDGDGDYGCRSGSWVGGRDGCGGSLAARLYEAQEDLHLARDRCRRAEEEARRQRQPAATKAATSRQTTPARPIGNRGSRNRAATGSVWRRGGRRPWQEHHQYWGEEWDREKDNDEEGAANKSDGDNDVADGPGGVGGDRDGGSPSSPRMPPSATPARRAADAGTLAGSAAAAENRDAAPQTVAELESRCRELARERDEAREEVTQLREAAATAARRSKMAARAAAASAAAADAEHQSLLATLAERKRESQSQLQQMKRLKRSLRDLATGALKLGEASKIVGPLSSRVCLGGKEVSAGNTGNSGEGGEDDDGEDLHNSDSEDEHAEGVSDDKNAAKSPAASAITANRVPGWPAAAAAPATAATATEMPTKEGGVAVASPPTSRQWEPLVGDGSPILRRHSCSVSPHIFAIPENVVCIVPPLTATTTTASFAVRRTSTPPPSVVEGLLAGGGSSLASQMTTAVVAAPAAAALAPTSATAAAVSSLSANGEENEGATVDDAVRPQPRDRSLSVGTAIPPRSQHLFAFQAGFSGAAVAEGRKRRQNTPMPAALAAATIKFARSSGRGALGSGGGGDSGGGGGSAGGGLGGNSLLGSNSVLSGGGDKSSIGNGIAVGNVTVGTVGI